MCNYSSSLTDSQSLLSLQNLTHNKAVAQALYIYKSTYYYLYKETSCDDLLITELSARIYQKITLKLLLRRLDICYIIYLDLWMVSWPQWTETKIIVSFYLGSDTTTCAGSKPPGAPVTVHIHHIHCNHRSFRTCN